MLETKRIKALMSLYYGTDSVAINTGNASQRVYITSDVVEAFRDIGAAYPNEISSESLKKVVVELLEDYFKDYLESKDVNIFNKDAFYRIETLLGMQGWRYEKHYIGVIRDIFGLDFKFKDHLQDHLLTDEIVGLFASLFGVTKQWLLNGNAESEMFTHNVPKNTQLNQAIHEGQSYHKGFISEIDLHIVKSQDPQGGRCYYAFQLLKISAKEDSRVMVNAIHPIAFVDESNVALLSDPIVGAIKDSQSIKGLDLDYVDFSGLVCGAYTIWGSSIINESKKIKLKDINDLIDPRNTDLLDGNKEEVLIEGVSL